MSLKTGRRPGALGGGAVLRSVCQSRRVESDHVDRPRQVEAACRPRLAACRRRVASRHAGLAGRPGRAGAAGSGAPSGRRKVSTPSSAANHGESAFVHGAMMATTQQHQVVEARGAAVGPVLARDARRTGGTCSPESGNWCRARRGRGGLTAEWCGSCGPTSRTSPSASWRMLHQRRVAREPSRRFRGNVQRAVIHLEGAIECAAVARGSRSVVRGRVGIHVQHHLVAVARGAAIEVRRPRPTRRAAPGHRPGAERASGPRPSRRLLMRRRRRGTAGRPQPRARAAPRRPPRA